MVGGKFCRVRALLMKSSKCILVGIEVHFVLLQASIDGVYGVSVHSLQVFIEIGSFVFIVTADVVACFKRVLIAHI